MGRRSNTQVKARAGLGSPPATYKRRMKGRPSFTLLFGGRVQVCNAAHLGGELSFGERDRGVDDPCTGPRAERSAIPDPDLP